MAERLVYKPPCGCEVYRIMNNKPNLYRIQYCSLHLSAPKLYGALQAVRQWQNDPEMYKEEIMPIVKKALALVHTEPVEDVEGKDGESG